MLCDAIINITVVIFACFLARYPMRKAIVDVIVIAIPTWIVKMIGSFKLADNEFNAGEMALL